MSEFAGSPFKQQAKDNKVTHEDVYTCVQSKSSPGNSFFNQQFEAQVNATNNSTEDLSRATKKSTLRNLTINSPL